MGLDVPLAIGSSPMFSEKNSDLDQHQLQEILIATQIELERYLLLYNNHPSIYFTLDISGLILSINQFGANSLLYSPSELIGQSIFSLVYPEDTDRLLAEYRLFLQESTTAINWEFRLVCKDGYVLSVRANLHLTKFLSSRSKCEKTFIAQPENSYNLEQKSQLFSDNLSSYTIHNSLLASTELVVLVVCEDITDFKIVGAALQENAQRFRVTFEQAGVGIAHVALDGKWLRVNQKLCEILGYTRREILQLDFQNIIYPEERELELKFLAPIITGKLQTFSCQKQYIRQSGDQVWINITISLVRDLQGIPQYFISVIEDITDPKKIEAELQENVKAWQTFLETVGEGVTLSNSVGQFEVFNSKMEEITGYSKEEANSSRDFLSLLYPHPEAHQKALAGVQEISQTGGVRDVETTIRAKDGTKKTLLVSTSIVSYKNRNLFLSAYRDITERKQAEQALYLAEAKYRSIFENAIEGIFQTTIDGCYLSANPALARIYGYSSPAELLVEIKDIGQQIYVIPERRKELIRLLEKEHKIAEFEFQAYRKDRRIIWISKNARAIRNSRGDLIYYEGTVEDITHRKQAQEAFRQQAERERLISMIQVRIRQSLNLQEIISITVKEVRQFLQTDRVLIYGFQVDGKGSVIVESRQNNCPEIQGTLIYDPCFSEKYTTLYQEGRVFATEDIHNSGLNPCHIELLSQFQVKASLVVPILTNKTEEKNWWSDKRKKIDAPNYSEILAPRLWGLLIAHHCVSTRYWQPYEIDLLKQLATQVGVAIYQSELYDKLHSANAALDRQVQERTMQLQQALDFEAMLKRITDKVRDSLDESQILQTAVKELACVLGVNCCDTALYNADQTTATISYECTTGKPRFKGKVVQMTDFYQVYEQLRQGWYFQFCEISGRIAQGTILACPILDNQGVLGDLWLFSHPDYTFKELEIRLVQQVANQCAIAIRQAWLFQAAQTQVQELEKINRLKDEFLSTVSHELRTPLSNMRMAIQMLAIALNQQQEFFGELAKPKLERSKVALYFQILQEECEREISLIGDLLDLQKLDATAEPLSLETISLPEFLSKIVAAFQDRASQHKQLLTMDISEDLPPLLSNSSSLGRIVSELLNNACKYTPAREKITLSVNYQAAEIILTVTNSGVEIPPDQIPRIFDKFYRIPRTDPWEQGGTGLGLTLVQKLVTYLGGAIAVSSSQGITSFQVTLPLTIASPTFKLGD